MPRKYRKEAEPSHADWETTIECLELQDSGYYDSCCCGWNGDHDEYAEESFWEQFEEQY